MYVKFTKTRVFCLLLFLIFIIWQILIRKYTFQIEINGPIMAFVAETQVVQTKEKIWQIEIPKISLIAEITNGTTKQILEQNVGHFSNTSKTQGNVGIAMIEKQLKNLRAGDEIIYRHNEFEKTYEIEKCRIIRDTEMEYLEETEDNMLTIITYVENYSKYRRCIQAVEKEDTIY